MRRPILTVAATVAATTGLMLTGGFLFGVPFVDAAVDDGDRPVFVAVDPPSRILDTRDGSDITAGVPLAAGTTTELTIAGAAGVPDDATAVELNVTVEQGTQPSYLTVWPDGAWPGTSTLNWTDGAPRPNGTTVGIGAYGKIRLLNYAGTVHVIVDVTGYYVDHTHDDRYYTKSEVDALIAAHDAKTLYAVVAPDGTLLRGSPGVTSSGDTGDYFIDFGRDLSTCVYTASVGATSPGLQYFNRTISANPGNDPAVVRVAVNFDGDPAASGVYLVAICP